MELSKKNLLAEKLQNENVESGMKQILVETKHCYGKRFTNFKKVGRYNESFILHHEPSRCKEHFN